jgi:serine/threonine-protein kinase
MAETDDILPPRYRDPQKVGRGGMGEIYHATDTTLGRAVAIKVLASRYAGDESVRARFTREALAAARLSGDPNTVTIFDVGEWEGRPFIVMSYLPGGSLEETLRREGAQPPSRVLHWLEQAANALDAAHAAGIVHRDVKPANLMLDADGNVHVGDFGIASAAGLDSFTKPGTVLGTAGYLAPEQALGERTTPATDQYALGVVGFELLTGTRPFASESPTAEASAHVNAPVPAISGRGAGLPRELDPVFARALAKDPAKRFPSAAAFVTALRDAFASGTGTTRQHRAPRQAPPPRRPRRRPWPLAAAAALLLGAAGVAIAVALAATDDGGDGGDAAPGPSTIVRTAPGTTVEVTVTAEQPPPPPAPEPPPPPPPPEDESGASLNDRGFELMQAGRYDEALPLLEQAVEKLSGSGELTEAYALFNLAATRAALGSCDGVEELLARSEEIQGHRDEFDQVRADCG